MQLEIDSTDNKKSIVRIGDTNIVKEYKSPRGQDVLRLVDQALKRQNLKREDLQSIKVNPGPGSFTSTRVGVAVANALGFALKIPVNDNPVGKFVKPVYDKPPSITKAK